MKLKLHKAGLIAGLLFLGGQASYAQTGGAYGGTAVEVSGPSTVIQFENYDLGQNGDATLNPTPTGPIGYLDKSAGNNGITDGINGVYRNDAVDIDFDAALPSQHNVNSIQGGEFLYYSINIPESFAGNYHIDINYKSGAGNKNVQIFLLTPTLQTSQILLNTTAAPDVPLGATSGVYANYSTLSKVIASGNWVIKVVWLSAGPNYDYFTLVNEDVPPLSVDDVQLKSNSLNIYPNPSNNGSFNIGVATKWDVYSLLGTKILEGDSKVVNLSGFAKGLYILKTKEGISKKLIYN